MLYNVTTMATTWHTVATRDTRLLRRQMDAVCSLPRSYTFLNYLRCHDDIGWGLDYPTLKCWGMEEVPHKRYLNEYFLGHVEGSDSRGALYNAVSGDGRRALLRHHGLDVRRGGPRALRATTRRWRGRSRRTSCSTPTCSRSRACPSSTAVTRSGR